MLVQAVQARLPRHVSLQGEALLADLRELGLLALEQARLRVLPSAAAVCPLTILPSAKRVQSHSYPTRLSRRLSEPQNV